jgi:hypothetical protein
MSGTYSTDDGNEKSFQNIGRKTLIEEGTKEICGRIKQERVLENLDMKPWSGHNWPRN